MKSERSSLVGSGVKISSGARRVEVEVPVGSADSRVTEETFVMVVMVLLG